MRSQRTDPVTAPQRRALHPLAWWTWSAALAVCAMQTFSPNPFLLLLIVAVACFVVATCRNNAPWSRSIGFFLMLGAVAIVVRIIIQLFFGQRGLPGHVLFTLPHVPLPHWAAGVSIGGQVTLESMLNASVLGLQIATILVCFGAANSLASPYRLLRCLPAVLYETGVAVTVALSFTPELIESILQVRHARRLRGHPTSGLRGLRGVAVPVLEGALDRSLQLATSMDARGYGRRTTVSTASRRLATTATVGGLLILAIGLYGVAYAGSVGDLGLPLVATGTVTAGAGLAVGGRRNTRSRYRPDPWRTPEWLVTASGLAALASFSIANALHLQGLIVSFQPLTLPDLPILPVVGILLALAPAVVTPKPPRTGTRHAVDADAATSTREPVAA